MFITLHVRMYFQKIFNCLYSDYYSHLTLNMELVLKIVAFIYHLISLTLDFRRMNYYQK